jgi:hypothetical protein
MTRGIVGEIRNKKSRTTFLDEEVLEVTPNTIGTLKLDFAAQKKGHGRLGRVETGLLARTLPIVTKEHANAHRRDALCPSPKIQMQAVFGITSA